MIKTTEQPSPYDGLEQMPVSSLLRAIHTEDGKIHGAVEKALPMIEQFIEQIVPRMQRGGRLFYIGAGTSGRLGVLDASEMPPTYGVPQGLVIGLIAGGDGAIRRAVEGAEDDPERAWRDISAFHPTAEDTVIGIAASGTTPYVVGGLQKARQAGLLTGSITCNAASPVARASEFPVEVIVGPEFVTGSTRMKSGTAQKMVLNMISTTVMIRLGRVQGNKMVHMQLTNRKLIDRGIRMIMEKSGLSAEAAQALLLKHGSVKKALDSTGDESSETTGSQSPKGAIGE
ncbi:MAG: N-acetylmuramic acid 6-phosphate etherase [Rikenellaceae bacterium]|nr:N-acetylmuramic acid 6-phosphate etherase [Rikenellaceae bacterium]